MLNVNHYSKAKRKQNTVGFSTSEILNGGKRGNEIFGVMNLS